MSSAGAAPRAAPSLSLARAAASRRNGAKSRGPKTVEGKARSEQNALKHGLRAQKHIVLPSENAAEFAELEAALLEQLAPDGALQSVLARRVVAAAWRLERAERLEAELFERHHYPGGNLGHALIRDGNGPRAFDTLLRYRGGTLAELWRALRTLKALQAEQLARPAPIAAPKRLLPEPHETPIEPESRGNPRELAPPRAASVQEPAPAAPVPAVVPCDGATARRKVPDEPESRENRSDSGRPRRGDRSPAEPLSLPIEVPDRGGAASLLAGTAHVSLAARRSL